MVIEGLLRDHAGATATVAKWSARGTSTLRWLAGSCQTWIIRPAISHALWKASTLVISNEPGVVVVANWCGAITTSHTVLPHWPRSRRRIATSATAIWPTVDWLRASRYTVVARHAWFATGCGIRVVIHNSMESFIVCLQRAVRADLRNCPGAVAVDGLAGRSTWIDRTAETCGWANATGLWRSSGGICADRGCCRGAARQRCRVACNLFRTWAGVPSGVLHRVAPIRNLPVRRVLRQPWVADAASIGWAEPNGGFFSRQVPGCSDSTRTHAKRRQK